MRDDTAAGNARHDSKTFVLRLSTEGNREHFSLEDPVTRARREFQSLRELSGFLAGLRGGRGPGRPRARERNERTTRRKAAILALAALLSSGTVVGETPRISLGQVRGRAGAAAAVPIVLVSGDAEPVGALSLRVRVEPPSAVEAVSFRRAGAWAAKKAAFEARPQSNGSFSWVVALSEPVAAASETLVGEVVVHLARGLAPDIEVAVVLDPAVSGFGDRAGTRFISADTAGLVVKSGAVLVHDRVPADEKR
ncbi:MAG: hypothetical protein ACYDBY_16270 [Thermoanaerobaculia bacterium]